MISYEGIHDTLNAILVIIIVSLIIAVAWLSTNVREQPLIATAVVVFQSENNGEGDQTRSQSDQNLRETQGNSVREGEATSIGSVSQVKENGNLDVTEESEMEVRQRSVGEVANECQTREAYDMSLPQPEEVSRNSLQSSNEKDSNTIPPDIHSDQPDVLQCLSEDLTSCESHTTNQPNESSIPSHVSPSEKVGDDLPEMEVRKRRLQQFISMGETTSCAETHSEQSVLSEPLGVRDTKNSAEDRTIETSDGAHLDEECSHITKTRENFSSSLVSDPASSVKENEEQERPPGSIKIRLKFLDETQRYVFAQLTEQVGSFKRQHFSIEMDANRCIRLIFNGQLLSQDTSTLAQYGLFDNCVVHCHVSQPQHTNRTNGQSELAAQDEDDAYVSGLLAPLLYCVMVVMWYLRYEYGHLFNTMSTVILLFLTALLLISTYLLYITQNVPENGTSDQISARPQTEAQTTL